MCNIIQNPAMNRPLLIFSIFILSINSVFSQEIDTTDIFEVNKQSYLVLKPEIEKRINSKIQPIIKERLEKYKAKKRKEAGEYFSEKEFQEDFKFAKDTIRINQFLNEYENSYSMATTTMGMNWKAGKYLDEYDKLLNEYYKKAQSVLTLDMQKKLIESQKKWLSYYENEKNFVYSLNDFGNHNSSLYCWGYYIEMMEKRVFFLREIYQGHFQNPNAYKEN
jgi:uncharacterized protein YecT (DUF1311 family)